MLYYNWNRYYIPRWGRYNRVDPLISNSELYRYSLNNSVKLTDMSGLITWDRNNFPPYYNKMLKEAFIRLIRGNLCNCAFKEGFGRLPWWDDYEVIPGDKEFCLQTGHSGYCCPGGFRVGPIRICLEEVRTVDDLVCTLAHEISHRSFGTKDDDPNNRCRSADFWGYVCARKKVDKELLKSMGIEKCCGLEN
jgi:hypothetical protein